MKTHPKNFTDGEYWAPFMLYLFTLFISIDAVVNLSKYFIIEFFIGNVCIIHEQFLFVSVFYLIHIYSPPSISAAGNVIAPAILLHGGFTSIWRNNSRIWYILQQCSNPCRHYNFIFTITLWISLECSQSTNIKIFQCTYLISQNAPLRNRNVHIPIPKCCIVEYGISAL